MQTNDQFSNRQIKKEIIWQIVQKWRDINCVQPWEVVADVLVWGKKMQK